MGSHQLPEIGNEDTFEQLIVDLFNEIFSTNTFKRFGRKGHNQKGIDIFSSEKDIVIQSKKKDLTRKERLLRSELLDDIEEDIRKTQSNQLKIKFRHIFFVSTYKNHPDIDEFCDSLREELNLEFEIFYWGWDTIEEKLLDSTKLLEKYYPKFIIKENSTEIQLKRDLELKKRINKDFSKWLDYSSGNRTRNSMMLLRKYDDKQYPYTNNPDNYGEYPYFKAEIHYLYHNGMEFIYGIESVYLFEDNTWSLENVKPHLKSESIKVAKIGRINFSDIVEYDINGDEYGYFPHIFCKFKHKGLPFEKTYFMSIEKGKPVEYFGI